MTQQNQASTAQSDHRLLSFYVRLLRKFWRTLPQAARDRLLEGRFAHHLARMVRRSAMRNQHFATFFLRNRAELALLQEIVSTKPQNATLQMTILACSKGSEVYSMMRAIRSARPDLQLRVNAVDISPDIVQFARNGVYSLKRPAITDLSSDDFVRQKGDVKAIPTSDPYAWIFEGVSEQEMQDMFDVRGEQASVKSWLREGITWMSGDANDPELLQKVGGPQEIVVANRFLCHMSPPDAENCLRNIGALVRPGGYLFVSGVDLDVRTKVASSQRWTPVLQRIREVHDGDPSLRSAWPIDWWGLEPLNDRLPEWQIRYASVFRIGNAPAHSLRTADSDSRQEMAAAAGMDS